MEEPIVAGVATDLSQAKITVIGVPDVPGKAAEIFKIVAKSGANVDMIVQNVSAAATGRTDISFTLPKEDAATALRALAGDQAEVGFESLVHDDQIGKLSVVGAGMRTHSGVSATLFEALSVSGINIEMISTSEIRISVVVRGDDLAEAARVVHTAYGLDGDADAVVHAGTGADSPRTGLSSQSDFSIPRYPRRVEGDRTWRAERLSARAAGSGGSGRRSRCRLPSSAPSSSSPGCCSSTCAVERRDPGHRRDRTRSGCRSHGSLRPSASRPMSDAVPAASRPAPVDLLAGTFVSHEHKTTGSVRVIEHPDGTPSARDRVGLETTNGPDVHVWLSAGPVSRASTAGSRPLATSTSTSARSRATSATSSTTSRPMSISATFRTVDLWCVQFAVSFGAAALA